MRALVLSGGGCRGAFQVGVLKKLLSEGAQPYDMMCGVSVGAINVSALAMFSKDDYAQGLDLLEKMWREEVRTSTVHKPWFFFGKMASLWKKSVFNSEPLKKFMQQHFSLAKMRASGIHVAVGACSLDSGKYDYGTKDRDDYVDWVLASSSFPILLTPVQIDGELWSDGGIKITTPLGYAIKNGATEIDVVLCYDPDASDGSWKDKRKAAVPSQMIRSLELMSNQIAVADLKIAGLKNEFVQVNDKYRKVKLRVYCPNGSLPVTDTLQFIEEEIVTMIKLGQSDAKTYMISE